MPPAAGPLAAGALGLVYGETLFSVVSWTVNVAATVGLGWAYRQHLGKDDDSDPNRPRRAATTEFAVTQSIPSKRIILGECTVGGVYCYTGSTALGSGRVDNVEPAEGEIYEGRAYYITQKLLAAHECEEVLWTQVNGSAASLTSTQHGVIAHATIPPLNHDGNAYMRSCFRLGRKDQLIDPLLKENFPDIPDTFRQRGQTTVTEEFFFGETRDENSAVYGEKPETTHRIRGLRVYDPRDPEQDIDDESTWKWTRNAALNTVALLTRPEFGRGVGYHDFDLGLLKDAAYLCDLGFETLNDGILPSYTCDGVVETNEPQLDVLEDLLTSCNARLTWSNSKYDLIVNKYKDPVDTLTDEDLCAEGFEFASGQPAAQRTNVLKINFISETQNNRRNDAPELELGVNLDDTGNPTDPNRDRQEKTVDLRFTENASRAQRIGWGILQQSKYEKSIKLTVGKKALRYTAGDVIRLSFASFPYVNGLYIIDTVDIAGDLSKFRLELTETGEDVDFWDASQHEKPFEPIVTTGN